MNEIATRAKREVAQPFRLTNTTHRRLLIAAGYWQMKTGERTSIERAINASFDALGIPAVEPEPETELDNV